MIAETTGELRLVIPAWGGIILAAIGIAYIILGTWWPRPLDVLSMTVLGCLVGLVACAWVPLAKPEGLPGHGQTSLGPRRPDG